MSNKRLLPTLLVGVVACLLAAVALVWLHYAWKGESVDAAFSSADGTRLVGRLLLPTTEPPHPAVIILHGAGAERHGSLGIRVPANYFVRSGVAALVYDKRGSGGSGGDFAEATYGDFVEDGVAAVRFLRSRPEISPGRIGLMGNSESGWFTPEIALRGGDVAFIINEAGSPLSWIDTVAWEVECQLRAEGFDPQRIDDAVAVYREIWRHYVEAHRLGRDAVEERRRAIESRIGALRRTPGFEDLRLRLREYDPALYSRLAGRYGYDPKPFLERLEVPILYALAGRDVNVPAWKSVARLEELATAGHSNVTWRVFENETHSFFKLTRPLAGGYPRSYHSWLVNWAKHQP